MPLSDRETQLKDSEPQLSKKTRSKKIEEDKAELSDESEEVTDYEEDSDASFEPEVETVTKRGSERRKSEKDEKAEEDKLFE